MTATKHVYGESFRLLAKAKASRTPVIQRHEMCTWKNNESVQIGSTARSTSYLTINDIPGPRPSIPFIGTGWQYFPGGRYSLASLHESAIDKYQRYGQIVKEEFQWGKPVIHLFNPDDFETVFRFQGNAPLRPISDFVKHYRQNNPDKYSTPGLANSVGDEWKALRNTLNPALLKLHALDGLIGPMNEIGDDFMSLLRKIRDPNTHKINNFQDSVYKLALEGVYMMSLDCRLGCLEPELQRDSQTMIFAVKLLFEAFQELFYGPALWKIIKTRSYKKLDQAESLMYEAANKRVKAAINNMRSCNEDKTGTKSVLQTLLQTEGLTDKEIIVTVIDFISGGIFTITNAFTFLIYHMARNPDVQTKLYEELRHKIPDGKITKEALERLPYLKACIKESFRLTSTIPCISRILPEPVILSGYYIPAGTPLFCNFIVPCKQAERYPEPERFNPDRWIKKTSRTNPFTLVPFGHGMRMCVGRRFAELEMHAALAKMVYNFKMEYKGPEIKCKQAFIVVPSEPVSVIIKDR